MHARPCYDEHSRECTMFHFGIYRHSSRNLSRTHSILTTYHSSTHRCILHKHCKCKSLCAWNFLSCLTCILLKRKFIPQASKQCQRALDRTRCHCLFVACLHLKCYCDSDSTKVATIQQPRRWPKRSSPLQDPRKRLWIFFFFWISHCQRCELWRPGGNIQRCLREQVSQRWNPEVRSRSAPALSSSSAQFKFRICWTRSPENKE